jgi:hypothetical protein
MKEIIGRDPGRLGDPKTASVSVKSTGRLADISLEVHAIEVLKMQRAHLHWHRRVLQKQRKRLLTFRRRAALSMSPSLATSLQIRPSMGVSIQVPHSRTTAKTSSLVAPGPSASKARAAVAATCESAQSRKVRGPVYPQRCLASSYSPLCPMK